MILWIWAYNSITAFLWRLHFSFPCHAADGSHQYSLLCAEVDIKTDGFKVSLMAHDSKPGFVRNRQIDVPLNQETFVLYSGVIMKSTEHCVASQCLLHLLFLPLIKRLLIVLTSMNSRYGMNEKSSCTVLFSPCPPFSKRTEAGMTRLNI